jgi:RNA polymerase sigma factor (sigma-70 family)
MKREYSGRNRTDDVLKPIVKQALSGNMDAYETLVLTYEKLVYNVCLRHSMSPEDAEDVTQEVFLKMCRALPGFKWESSFNTWIYRITKNACLDFIRSRGGNIALSLTYEDSEDGESKESDIADPSPLPCEQLEHNEKIRLLHAAIDRLPPSQREIILLRDIEGYSYAQISDMLSLEEGTVKSRLSRARQALKDELGTLDIFSP